MNRRTRAIFAVSLLLNVAVVAAAGAYVWRQGGTAYVAEKLGLRDPPVRREAWQADQVAMFRTYPQTSRDVVFFGDSLTAATPFAEVFSPVKNRGIGGETTAGGLARLGDVLAGRPERLFILLGTNDVARQVDADTSAGNVRAMLRAAREGSPATRVYLISALPVNNDVMREPLDRNPAIDALNDRLAKVAAELAIPFLDVRASFRDGQGRLRDDLTTDGLHLNHTGRLVLCDALREHVVADRPDLIDAPTTPPAATPTTTRPSTAR